jgi:hypothetical protein
MQKGHAVVERMVQTCSEITWYVDRCMLIQRFFGALDGFDIRKMQYLEPEYTDTPLLATIQRIDDLVCTRFAQRFGEPLC